MSETDWTRIAGLVADGVDLSKGDKVSVFMTDPLAMPAVESFVEECYRRGAVPQVLATDERFDRAALRWSDPSALSEAPPLEAAAMEWSDVHVSFRAMVDPVLDAEPARIASLRRGRGIVSTLRWQHTRWALVRVPTPVWADVMGLDAEAMLTQWADSFDADWSGGRARMQRLCDLLAESSRAVISDDHGVLEIGTAGRSWIPFSGNANWPDGEIATAPVETDLEGVVRFPGRFAFGGVMVRDLELVFDQGLVVAERAAEGRAFVQGMLATDEGARRVGEFGIGTNAAIIDLTGDLLIDEKILGTAHIALGRAYPECGGINESAIHWDIVKDLRGLAGAAAGSLRVGDEWLIKDGVVQPLLAEASVP